MLKKLAVVVFFLGIVTCMSISAYSEDSVMNPADETVAIPPDEEALPAEEGVGEGVITGDVTGLDTTAGSVTIKADNGAEKTFSVIDGETILWKGIEDIKLTDIKKGDKAEVGYYTDDAGKLIASWVDVIVPEQPVAATGDTPVSPAEPSAANEE